MLVVLVLAAICFCLQDFPLFPLQETGGEKAPIFCCQVALRSRRSFPVSPISGGGFINTSLCSSPPCKNAVEMSSAGGAQTLHAATANRTLQNDFEQTALLSTTFSPAALPWQKDT